MTTITKLLVYVYITVVNNAQINTFRPALSLSRACKRLLRATPVEHVCFTVNEVHHLSSEIAVELFHLGT